VVQLALLVQKKFQKLQPTLHIGAKKIVVDSNDKVWDAAKHFERLAESMFQNNLQRKNFVLMVKKTNLAHRQKRLCKHLYAVEKNAHDSSRSQCCCWA
jgi:hypothetical protein